MRNIVLLFILFITYTYPQIQPLVPDFLISGNDNFPSTFIQNSPGLYYTSGSNFVAAWTDYREGNPVIYAQKFNKIGNKTGENFRTSSNAGIYLNKEGYLLSLNKIYSYYFDDTFLYLTARLYNNSHQEIVEQGIYSTIIPWCGTGYIPGEDFVVSSDKSFYFITNTGGQVSLVKIENEGQIKNINLNFDDLYTITQITSAVTDNGNYFFAWINGSETDSMATGLYATFINKDDSLILSRLRITPLEDSVGLWGYVGNYTLKSIALNDSTFKLFWLNNAASKLYSVKLNIKGEIISGIDTLLVPGSGQQYEEISNVILTNKNEESFYLFVSHSYYDLSTNTFTHSFIKYDSEGEQQGDIVSQQGTNFFANNLFILVKINFSAPIRI
jgi:hypothetical protein